MKLLFILAIGTSLWAQGPVRTGAMDQTVASVPNLPAHKIGPNDLLALSVYDAPELTRTLRVGGDGTIDLPLLKDHIQAGGLRPDELEASIVATLKAEKILVRPLVSVTIIEYNDRHVSVMGAVRKPLTFPLIGATRLMDALAKAEGTAVDAGPELFVTRQGQATVERINLNELISGNNPALNIALEGGEEVRIPEAKKVYVVGNIKKPGAIPFRNAADCSVLKVLAVVEGVLPYAQDKAWIYRAEPETGKRIEIPVELKKILDRKSPDIMLREEDIFYVPDNRNKRQAMQAGKALLTFGSGTVSALIYAGVRP